MELVVSFLQSIVTIVVFIVLLGALVVIHELGHFVVARLAGIRVHEFGIGFPPRAKVMRHRGETAYTLNWLPLGGFVKLEGEDGDSDDPRSFTRAPFPLKVLVLVAGVVMNLLLAFVILAGIAWAPQTAWGIRFEAVQPGSPAAAADLAPGDLIVEIDGRRYDQLEADRFVADLRSYAGRSVTLGVIRGGATLAADGSGPSSIETITPTLRSAAELEAGKGALGIERLGYAPSAIGFTRSPGDALGIGWSRTADAFLMIARGLGDVFGGMLTRPTEAPAASGPVGIAVTVGDVLWGAGLTATLYLAAILSANLALVNILPFPPLDGGRILMLGIKAIAGRRVSVRAERLTYLVGFVFLFTFIIWITLFDLARLGGAVQ